MQCFLGVSAIRLYALNVIKHSYGFMFKVLHALKHIVIWAFYLSRVESINFVQILVQVVYSCLHCFKSYHELCFHFDALLVIVLVPKWLLFRKVVHSFVEISTGQLQSVLGWIVSVFMVLCFEVICVWAVFRVEGRMIFVIARLLLTIYSLCCRDDCNEKWSERRRVHRVFNLFDFKILTSFLFKPFLCCEITVLTVI